MNTIHFTPFPTLMTERLILRQMTEDDLDEFYILKSDRRIVEPYGAQPKTYEQARAFLEKLNAYIRKDESIVWGIALKEENRLIGSICYWNMNDEGTKAEVGYELMVEQQGKGYMQEALEAVIQYGFQDMKLNRIEAVPNPKNFPSVKLLKRSHFIQGETFTEPDFNGKPVDRVLYFLEN